MQGTVRSFSSTSHAGDVLLDDGTLLPFDGAAFARSGLLLLRLGQRVRLRVEGEDDDRRIVFLTLATFPDR